jgi:sugar/nucleoside kinase (ribokinase family)
MKPDIVVAGHICLDIIPELSLRHSNLGAVLEPGRLLEIGPAISSTGGAVANVGLALHRLGVPVRLMGKIGDDPLGSALLNVLQANSNELAAGMIVSPGESTSYTVVLSPPGVDRIFLHHPGANATFTASDVPYEQLTGARLFHFGYPPLMRSLYDDGGAGMKVLFRRVQEQGVATSLDMSLPDADSPAGQVDWTAWLQRVLPHVDIFCPSFDEILFMLGWPAVEKPDAALLRRIASQLLEMGVAAVAIKMGEWGLWVQVTQNAARLASIMSLPQLSQWRGREAYTPCFQIDVVGTTGAGDSTIAGFLAGIVEGLPLQDAATLATAVGACCCEGADASSGIPAREVVMARVQAGWPRQNGIELY